jgi:adenylate cyclase
VTTDGEVKEVAVLFTDVRGFTSFSEDHSLRAANSLLNNFYDMVIHHTQKNGGIVDKFMGDGTMCIFGAFDDDESYVIRSVHAAKGILRDFVQMTTQKHQPSLFLGAGITKGPAMLGMFGNGEFVNFTAIGSIVNLAARIQGKSDDNNLLVTKDVVDYLPSGSYKSKGRHSFKNVSKRVEVFEVL